MARELAAAPRAAVYGRIGTTTQALRDDRELARRRPQRRSPATSTAPAARCSRAGGRLVEHRRRARARPRRAPSAAGTAACAGWARSSASCRSACLAEEIETPGEGQVRALITVAGNPVVSTPNSDRLAAALERLDFMVAIDIYVNETTRHADVILPGALAAASARTTTSRFYGFAVRNVANYSPPVLRARRRACPTSGRRCCA